MNTHICKMEAVCCPVGDGGWKFSTVSGFLNDDAMGRKKESR